MLAFRTFKSNFKQLNIKTMENQNYLTLKWGTLKSWDFKNSGKGKELLKEYREI